MQKILPYLQFGGDALPAVSFYVKRFAQGGVRNLIFAPDAGLPEAQQSLTGKPLLVEFELEGTTFLAENLGEGACVSPSSTFQATCDWGRDLLAEDKFASLWVALTLEGQNITEPNQGTETVTVGWAEDRYGYLWRTYLGPVTGERLPAVMPVLLFGGDENGEASSARQFYTQIFGTAPEPARGQPPALQPGGMTDSFTVFPLGDLTAATAITPASVTEETKPAFVVRCANQNEIDSLWQQLSAVPAAEGAGWCTDKFGVRWRLVPENFEELLQTPDAYRKISLMTKLVIDELR